MVGWHRDETYGTDSMGPTYPSESRQDLGYGTRVHAILMSHLAGGGNLDGFNTMGAVLLRVKAFHTTRWELRLGAAFVPRLEGMRSQ